MTRCGITLFREGVADTVDLYRNALGWTYRVWKPLYECHLKLPNATDVAWMMDAHFFEKLEAKELPLAARTVLHATYDWAVVLEKDFHRFATYLSEFDKEYPCGPFDPNHLPMWAARVRACKAEAIGFDGELHSRNLWFADGEPNKGKPYDLGSGDSHWDIFQDHG